MLLLLPLLLPHHLLLLLPHLLVAAPLNQEQVADTLNKLDLGEVVSEAHSYLHHLKEGHIAQDRAESLWGGVEKRVAVFQSINMGPSTTYMGPALSTMVSVLQLSKVFYEFENSLFGAASCTFCKAGFMFLQYYLDRDIDMEEFKRDASLVCRGIRMVSQDVCRGLIDTFTGDMYHVVRKSDQSPEEMCGFMFGEGCSNPPNPSHEWSAMIPPLPPSLPAPTSFRAEKILSVLHLSDTHWDPFYLEGSQAACGDPLCCRESSGQVQDPWEKAGYWGDYRKCDTPLRTIEAMYRHIAAHHKVDLIYWTGDLPPHDIWNQTRSGNLKVVRATARQLKAHFPSVPVLPALGNHESVPVDSFPPPTVVGDLGMSWLYSALSDEWGEWVGQGHNWTIQHGAYYSLNVAPGLRVISLNMNYCMNKNLWLLLNSTDPADELLWLVFELQLAEFKGEKVHILGHIPPGHVDCVRVWSNNFHSIISRYRETVTAQFYGHTHTDEFQVFYSKPGNQPISMAYIAPAVTPYHGLNPAYRIYSVSAGGQVLDHETHFMDLKDANERPEEVPVWKLLYSARSSYSLADLSPQSWHSLVTRLQANRTLFDEFYRHYYSGSPVRPPCDPVCRHKLLCSLVSARSHSTAETCRDISITSGRAGVVGGWWKTFQDVLFTP